LKRRDIEKEIKTYWFKKHKAILTQCGELQILDWREPGTSSYYCRYIFDNNKIYISGDIGAAVFRLTWKADINSFNDINIGYFEEKLEAYSGDRRDFDPHEAVSRIKEWKKELKENGTKFDKEIMANLIESADSCSRKEEWAYEYINGTYNDFIRELDDDYWEWVYNIGDVIPCRVKAYLIGLKMASKQLQEVSINV